MKGGTEMPDETNTVRRKSQWRKTPTDDKIFLIVVYAVLLIIVFLCVYPLYFTVIASVSDPFDLYSGKVNLLPSGFTLDSYKAVFENSSIWMGYANTILYTVLGTAFNMVLTIPAAYALSKKQMLGRSALMTVFLIAMYFSGGMIPTYMLYKKLALLNTRTVLILHGGVNIYNVIVARTYFENNISESLFEAARIDGASELGIFFRIVLPLSAPILAVLTLYYAVAHWSSYFPALIYTTDTAIQPLQLVLRRILILNESAYSEAMESGDATVIADAARRTYLAISMKYSLVFVASAPMLIAYPFVQKYFVTGVMVGSVKG